MDFFTTTTFRKSIEGLTKKTRDGYMVKLRVANSGQHLPKNNGFRLIYLVSMRHDSVVLMCIYPKRGPLSAVDLVNAEYTRLQTEVFNESKACMLHRVDISEGLEELNLNACLPGGK